MGEEEGTDRKLFWSLLDWKCPFFNGSLSPFYFKIRGTRYGLMWVLDVDSLLSFFSFCVNLFTWEIVTTSTSLCVLFCLWRVLLDVVWMKPSVRSALICFRHIVRHSYQSLLLWCSAQFPPLNMLEHCLWRTTSLCSQSVFMCCSGDRSSSVHSFALCL